MKYLFSTIITLFLAISVNAQNDAISKYFDQYLDDDNFTVVYVSGKMFSMISKVDIEELQDEEAQIIMDVAKDIKGLRVLVTDIDPKQYYKQARKLIKDDEGTVIVFSAFISSLYYYTFFGYFWDYFLLMLIFLCELYLITH